MSSSVGHRRRRAVEWLGVAVYVLFVFTASFGHHDLVCHLKTPQHCTSCAASAPGASPHSQSVLGPWALGDAGLAVADLPRQTGALLAVRSTGRSPPTDF